MGRAFPRRQQQGERELEAAAGTQAGGRKGRGWEGCSSFRWLGRAPLAQGEAPQDPPSC